MKKAKRMISTILLMFLLLFNFSACGESDDVTTTGQTTETPASVTNNLTTKTTTTTTNTTTTSTTVLTTAKATTTTASITPSNSKSNTKPTSVPSQKIDSDQLNQKLDEILNKYGRTPRAIYDYVHDHYKYKYAPEKSKEENAMYLIENGTGSCYHFAALTYLLFKRAGYETYYVTGLGWQHHTYHCWIMAKFDGGWYHVDSLYVRSAKFTSARAREIGYEWDESNYPI